MNKACLSFSALLIVACCFAQPLVAQNPTKSVRRGYKIEYTRIIPNGVSGFVPIRVRVTRTPAVPSTNDESLNVSVNINNDWDLSSNGSEFSTELILQGGKTSAEVELLVELNQNGYDSLVVEKGSRHTNSRGNDLLYEQIAITMAPTTDNNWLLISSKAPKSRSVSRTYFPGQPLANGNSYPGVATVIYNEHFSDDNEVPGLESIFGQPLAEILGGPDWHALQPADLPETWVGLSSVIHVLISNDEFKSLTQVPAYRKILEQWVAAGGYLIVFNPENSLAHAGSIFPSLLGSERSTQPRMWSPVSTKRNGGPIGLVQEYNPEPASELVAKDRAAFAPYLNGMVVVMVPPERLPSWFGNRHFEGYHPITSQANRVGGLGRESAIPGVGKPPIALFGVFTGLFLFLIGPVILVIVTLNNDRRFLFFFVPLFSFLTCTGILGYAIVADFSKQLARTNTITTLDSRSGFAYSKAYSAYYCGSQPPYYAYDLDTLIQTTIEDKTGYRIRKLPEENRLSSPRIQPRKNHEVYTAKPYRTQQRFLVAKSAEKPSIPEVTNLLGGRIKRAYFEYEGKTYLVRDLDPKQTTLGIEMPPANCWEELKKVVNDQDTRGGSPLFRSGRTEINAAVHSMRNLGPNKLFTHYFVAIIDVNPAIAPLIEPFEYKLQLHVVHGNY